MSPLASTAIRFPAAPVAVNEGTELLVRGKANNRISGTPFWSVEIAYRCAEGCGVGDGCGEGAGVGAGTGVGPPTIGVPPPLQPTADRNIRTVQSRSKHGVLRLQILGRNFFKDAIINLRPLFFLPHFA